MLHLIVFFLSMIISQAIVWFSEGDYFVCICLSWVNIIAMIWLLLSEGIVSSPLYLLTSTYHVSHYDL